MLTTEYYASRMPERTGLPRLAARIRAMVTWWRRNTTLAVRLSFAGLALIVIPVIFADKVSPHEPTAIDLRNRLLPPVWADEGTWEYPLGPDATGRDTLTRSLDQVIMFLVDVQLSLPFILLAVAVALVLGKSLPVLVGIAALSTWPHYARVVRGVVLTLNEREIVVASRAIGAGHRHIMIVHMLPNLLSSMLVLATLSLGRIILLESGLSFLGIGVRPPTPSWGNMISDGRQFLTNAPWCAVMPGLALVIVTMAVGTIGDWLRDVTDVTTDR